MQAIVLIAHGSKKENSNNEFLSMVKNIEECSNFDLTKAAFLELANPSIQDVVNEFIEKGVNKISFYPFFLNSGKHVVSDIPNIIKKFEKDNPTIKFDILEHFGKSKKIEEIILSDIN